MAYPPPQAQMAGMTIQPGAMVVAAPAASPQSAGSSAMLNMFTQGNVITLKNLVSKRYLQVSNGKVSGGGADGVNSQFTVHVRGPGKVALQSVGNPAAYIALANGATSVGNGGPFCDLVVKDVGHAVVFESTQNRSFHIGVLQTGALKSAASAGTGNNARFTPRVISTAPVVTVVAPVVMMQPQPGYPMQYPGPPPPQQYPQQYPPPPQQYPPGQVPPQQYPPGQYPPGQYPPDQGAPQQYPPGQGPPPPQQYPPPTAPPPAQAEQQGQVPMVVPVPVMDSAPPAQLPPAQGPPPPAPMGPSANEPVLIQGFSVTDAFKEGNVVQLVARSNGNPMNVKNATVFGNGTFSNADSQFEVSIPSGVAPGTHVVVLRNVSWQACYITIKGNSVTTKGDGKKNCYLRVHVLPDNYVYFESTEHPGHYLGIAKNGSACKPKEVRPESVEAQFFVRVEKQTHPYSETIMTPFGRPSIINSLRDRSVIQLYIKSSGNYLSINDNGVVMNTGNAGDVHTFFILRDRGMGIVSLDSYKHTGFRLRMANFVLQGKGTGDVNADFRVKESPDGALYLESVTCPTACVGIQSEGQLKTGLSVFLMNIQKFGDSETITKQPLN